MTTSAGKGEKKKLHPPFAQPDPGRRAAAEQTEIHNELESSAPPYRRGQFEASAPDPVASTELPSIDQFLDELPPIEEFLIPSSPTSQPVVAPPPRRTPVAPAPEIDSEGWASGEWQSYDWNRVAALGAPAPEAAAANAEWSSTDWDSSRRASGLPQAGGLPATEVAAALDEIARRIRSGELSLERFYGSPPEAAIAAVFAALLRTRG
jgi:hypothetical protein